jgi:ABC-type sugar transport system ATPase subunit
MGTILRNGRVVETLPITPESTEDELIELMIGQEVKSFYRQFDAPSTADHHALLEVENLTILDKVKGVDFYLRAGEILGITGLLGAGQNELVRALFGIGGVSEDDQAQEASLRITHPGMLSARVFVFCWSRKEEGLFLDMSQEHLCYP